MNKEEEFEEEDEEEAKSRETFSIWKNKTEL